MRNEEIFEICKRRGFLLNTDIKPNCTIILKNHREIKCNYLTRLNFSKKCLYISYGHTEPFGNRMKFPKYITPDGRFLFFYPGNIENDSVCKFREPKIGDIINFTESKIYYTGQIIDIKRFMNENFIEIFPNCFDIRKEIKVSFYDEKMKSDNCDMNNSQEGLYFNIIFNESYKKKDIKFDEKIKYKEIVGINV